MQGPPDRTRAPARGGPPDTAPGVPVIVDFFLSIWTTVTNWMIGFLPGSESDPLSKAAGASWSMFGTMNYFLPVGELAAVMVTVLLLGGPMLAASAVIWFVVGVLRGGATKA